MLVLRYNAQKMVPEANPLLPEQPVISLLEFIRIYIYKFIKIGGHIII